MSLSNGFWAAIHLFKSSVTRHLTVATDTLFSLFPSVQHGSDELFGIYLVSIYSNKFVLLVCGHSRLSRTWLITYSCFRRIFWGYIALHEKKSSPGAISHKLCLAFFKATMADFSNDNSFLRAIYETTLHVFTSFHSITISKKNIRVFLLCKQMDFKTALGMYIYHYENLISLRARFVYFQISNTIWLLVSHSFENYSFQRFLYK